MALGFAEIPFLGVTAVVADRAVKAANVRLLGIEATGNENLLVRLEGDSGAVEYAMTFIERCAVELGVQVVIHRIVRPDQALDSLIQFSDSRNPLYGGREHFVPMASSGPESKHMTPKQQALGILETQGLTAVLEAADTMLKASNVTLVGKEKIGAAYVTVIIKGDVASVTAAVDAGAKAVGTLGKLIAAHIIARPHEDLVALLPK